MISILDRYIIKTVILATLIIMLLVTGLAYVIDLLTELKDIGDGDYGLIQAAIHALFILPHNIYQFFPMLVLLGGLSGLGSLATHQELVVMRVSGISIPRIIRSVLTAALILVIIGLLIGELLAPRALFLANKHKSSAENKGQAVATASGVWIHEGTNFLHIKRVMSHNHLEGVTRYEFDSEHRLLAAYYVKSLDFKNKQWLLHNIVKTTFTKNRTRNQSLVEGKWNLVLNPNLLNVGLMEPEEMSLVELFQYTQHLMQNKSQAKEFQFSFWKRIFQPLTVLVMLLLAIPFVFAAPRSVTAGWRMLLGVLVGFTFYILNALLGQLSVVFQLLPFVAALLPILLFALLGYLLLLRLS